MEYGMNQMNEQLGSFIGFRRNAGTCDKMSVRGDNAVKVRTYSCISYLYLYPYPYRVRILNAHVFICAYYSSLICMYTTTLLTMSRNNVIDTAYSCSSNTKTLLVM